MSAMFLSIMDNAVMKAMRRSLEYPQHFKMGQRLRLKLTDCSYSNVVQVDVETDKGTASYSFQ